MKLKKDSYRIKQYTFTREEMQKAFEKGLTISTLQSRIYQGWTKEQALKYGPIKDGRKIFYDKEKRRKREEESKKTPKTELRKEIGRIKYMQKFDDLLNPPVITKRMMRRAKEYNLDISKIRPIKVDISELPKKVMEDDAEESGDTPDSQYDSEKDEYKIS